jgi:hypothetical protein
MTPIASYLRNFDFSTRFSICFPEIDLKTGDKIAKIEISLEFATIICAQPESRRQQR